MRFAALPMSLVLVLAARSAAAADAEPAWDPGNPTTSPLPGEIQPKDAPVSGDGVYGRLQAPVTLGLHAGVEAARGGPAAAGRVAAHYYFTAGVYAGYAEAVTDSNPKRRWLSLGLDLQPAFLPRWSQDLQRGPGRGDLFLDSISLAFGAYFLAPRDMALGEELGFELSLGAGLPLLASVEGPWLGARGQLRFRDPSRRDPDPDAQGSVLITLGYRFVAGG